MKRKIPLWIALTLIVLVGAAAAAAGAVLGFRDGASKGLAEGERRAAVKAARQPPLVTFDRRVAVEAIFTPARIARMPDAVRTGLTPESKAAVTRILNRAPSSFYRLAVKGVSLASSLVAPEKTKLHCQTAFPQVALAWSAWNTFHDEEEAIAVLKVERRREIKLEGQALLGPKDAPVTIIEYADYQCPYCVRVKPLVAKMLERGDVNFAFKHFPLNFHHAAKPAAYAVEAAALQGKRWEMHDALFALGKKIKDGINKEQPLPKTGPVPFEAQAKALGLDLDAFRKAVRDPKIHAAIKADIAEAKDLNINSTPSFFINQRRVVEDRSVGSFNKLVDLAKAEAMEGKFSWGIDDVPGPKKIPSEKELLNKGGQDQTSPGATPTKAAPAKAPTKAAP